MVDNTFVTTAPAGEATAETSLAAIGEKLPQTLGRLTQLAPVVVIKTVPTLHSSIEIGLKRDPKGYEPSLAEYRAVEAEPNAIIDRAARSIRDLRVLDPATVLCRDGKCHAVLNGVQLYADDNTHLSDDGALLFVPALAKLVP
jgi:hypothetical protein